MKFSQGFITTTKEIPKTADTKSHILSLRSGLLYMASAGIYAYLPLGYRILRNIEKVIRRNMDSRGARELLMPALQPMEIWEKTGRDKDLEEVMFKFTDRKKRDLCLGPTHEEMITEIVKKNVFSYKQLPLILYQIQTKFRDETRPRFGLIRSCEFIMKDAYSFDVDHNGLEVNYAKMFDAYKEIFSDCGLDIVITEADSGAMGGDISHEFMAPADIGEDILYLCPHCEKYQKQTGKCGSCGVDTGERRMIEVGHIFKLGTKYSRAQGARVLDASGAKRDIIMGCYGIGVSRLIPAIIEQNSDDKGIIWPVNIAPFDVIIVPVNMDNASFTGGADRIYGDLTRAGLNVLLDDRKDNMGVKINDAYLIGSPVVVIIGKKYSDNGMIELERRKTGEKIILSPADCVNLLLKDRGIK